MDRYRQYEEDCKKIRLVNQDLLTGFETWLLGLGLARKTSAGHRLNVDCFINEFLLNEDAIAATEGVYHIDLYLGGWFIEKAMWASPASIKSSAASIKKFYAFLLTQGLVTQSDINLLAQTIKDEMPAWLKAMKRQQDRFDADEDD